MKGRGGGRKGGREGEVREGGEEGGGEGYPLSTHYLCRQSSIDSTSPMSEACKTGIGQVTFSNCKSDRACDIENVNLQKTVEKNYA